MIYARNFLGPYKFIKPSTLSLSLLTINFDTSPKQTSDSINDLDIKFLVQMLSLGAYPPYILFLQLLINSITY
jgi:hypothetical protein